jgi:myosin-7
VSSTVLTELLKYDLKNYYDENLAERYSFFRRVSTENIMRWTNKEISTPLLKLELELKAVAVQLFRNLMSYMTDRKSSKKPLAHVKKHLKLTMNADEKLKDEAYLQVLKQIKDHRETDKALRGWNLFAILASCYPPSQNLYYSILNFLFFEIKNQKDKIILSHVNYVFLRLYKTMENPRKQIPSDTEIAHIEEMKPMIVSINFFNETSVNLEFESYTTIKELKMNLMKKLGFNATRAPYYSLYEICNKKDKVEERFLDDYERVADIIALWEKEIEECLKNKEQVEFKMYLKIFLYFPYNENDIDTVSIIYYQTVYDTIGGKYQLREEDVVTLASLQLLIDYGTDYESAYQALQKLLDKYVPMNLLNNNTNVYWVQKIMELYSGLKATSKQEAKLTYLEQLKTSPLWEAQQFLVKYSSKNVENPENLPEEIILGIKPNGISIYDMERVRFFF